MTKGLRNAALAAIAALALGVAPALAQTPSTSTSKTPSTTTRSHGTTSGSGSSATQSRVLDINTATASELDALPGIGKKRAQAIISHRPYKSKDELVSRKVIPETTYNQIKDRIIARQKS